MKFRLISDLHLDFSWYKLPEMEDDKNTTLIIAGDICEGRYTDTLFALLDEMTYRFQSVIFVLGNHDFYGANLYTHVESLKKRIYTDYHNVYLLDNNYQELSPDVVVVGATLWTDFDNQSPFLLANVERCMADYMWISKGKRKWKPDGADGRCMEHPARITTDDIFAEFNKSKWYLQTMIRDLKNQDKKVVVVTHHAPSWKSVTPRFRGDALNGAFVSDLSELILDTNPDVWCHGHVHSYHDYMIDNTRVICNSRGYHKGSYSEDTEFDPLFYFEV